MRKKNQFAALLLSMMTALSLTGCGEKPPQPTREPPVQVVRPATEPEASVREQETTLSYLLEGQETTVEVTLYSEEGYSLYMPGTGWNFVSELDDGIPTRTWENQLNHQVELEVLYLEGRDLKEAQAWVCAEEDDFRLDQDGSEGLMGADREDGELLEVRFFEAEQGTYALLLQYPEEAAEGFGVLLGVLADTFQLTA